MDTGGIMPTNHPRPFLLASAVLWILGAVFLFAALAARNGGLSGDQSTWTMFFRLHDIAAPLAALAIAAAAWNLRGASTRDGTVVGRRIAWLGAICGISTALLLALVFLTGASDMLYMLPQGGVGLWLIALCARKPVALGGAVRALGYVAGTGLVLIGISFVMIATAQGAAIWALTDAQAHPVAPADEASALNLYGHYVITAGTLLGIPTYPLWAWLASRAKRRDAAAA